MANLFDLLEPELDKPPSKPHLQQWDNYGIYTIVSVDIANQISSTSYFETYLGNVITNFNPVTNTASLVPITPPRLVIENSTGEMIHFLAIQSYAPTLIPINFLDYVNLYHGQ